MAAPKTVLTYPLNGTLKDFNIPFEYLARKFVVVTLIGATRRVLVLNSEYRFTTKKQITTTAAWGPAQGFENIEIRRVTSATERLVDFSDGSILRAYDLNTAQVQSLHIAEEARDLTADTIGVNNDGDLDARGRGLVNLRDGVNPGDAVTMRQEASWAASTLGNKNASETARTGAEAARDASIAAKDSANSYKGDSLASANASEASNQLSKLWASKPEDQVVSSGLYSSYHYSRKSAAQVSLATDQAVTATNQAGIATSQVSLATTQAGIATTKAAESAASAAAVGGVIAVNRTHRNLLINGNFLIFQRRTSWTMNGGGAVYVADRWGTFQNNGTNTISYQIHTYGQTAVPDNPSYFLRHTFSGQGIAAGDFNHVVQAIEGASTAAGSTATLTFWAKAASAGQKIAIEFVQSFGTGGSAYVTFGGKPITLTTSWAKYTTTVAIPSVAGKTKGASDCLQVHIHFTGGSDVAGRCATTAWNTAGTVDLSQVQFEVGTGTPFEVLPPQVILDMCSRYYESMNGTVSASHGPYDWHQWKVAKYRTPNLGFISGSSPGTWADQITLNGFRWGSPASTDADWMLAIEAEIL